MFLISNNKAECCGCSACQQICATRAISMQADQEGFLYPIKDLAKCTDCGLCEKVCAFTEPVYTNEKPLVYAACMKDETERQRSSSGALFYAIAMEVIHQNGVVYGAVLDSSLCVVHQKAETQEELFPLRGSKYVQSDLKDTYTEVRSLLKSNRFVYFTGTPCQVAGLKSFLRKEYSNLLTSDIVCHGVPSQKFFDMHLSYLSNKYKGKIINYLFRKNEAWRVCEIVTYSKKGRVCSKELPIYELSPFLYSFMYAFNYRYSCYQCPFAKVPRQSDITLADFWGVTEFFPAFDTSKGCSLTLLNTEKGKKFWQKISDEIYSVESDVSSAAKFNGNLIHHTLKPIIRDEIYERIERDGYERIANTLFRNSNYRKMKIRLLIRSIIGYKLINALKKLKR